MVSVLKKILFFLMVPFAFLIGSSFASLKQVKGTPGTAPSFLVALPDGSLVQANSTDLVYSQATNTITATAKPSLPSITVTQITAATPNNFPIPAGKTLCYVSRNLPQALGIDYAITAGAVVFNPAPDVGDIVQLVCF